MTPDNTEARLDAVLRANANLAARVTELEIENRRLRQTVPGLREPLQALEYAGRVARAIQIAAAAAQRNGHNGLAALLKERALSLVEALPTDPRLTMPDIDPPFSKHSPLVEDDASHRRLLDALA